MKKLETICDICGNIIAVGWEASRVYEKTYDFCDRCFVSKTGLPKSYGAAFDWAEDRAKER